MTNTLIAFLIISLLIALLLFAVVSAGAGKSRHRSRHSGSRGFSPHSSGRHTSSHNSVTRLHPAELQDRWNLILATSRTGGTGLKSAINEADKLFDHVLRSSGLPGDTMGDRLKAARSRFSSHQIYDGIWQAHKLRNSLAHDIGFDLVPSQANEALRHFERGLKDLGAL